MVERSQEIERSSPAVRVTATCYIVRMRPVEAWYEDGLLKPAQPLKLRQGEKVAVIVLRHPDRTRWDLKRLATGTPEDETLAAVGLDAWADALDVEDRR